MIIKRIELLCVFACVIKRENVVLKWEGRMHKQKNDALKGGSGYD